VEHGKSYSPANTVRGGENDAVYPIIGAFPIAPFAVSKSFASRILVLEEA